MAKKALSIWQRICEIFTEIKINKKFAEEYGVQEAVRLLCRQEAHTVIVNYIHSMQGGMRCMASSVRVVS